MRLVIIEDRLMAATCVPRIQEPGELAWSVCRLVFVAADRARSAPHHDD